jgi:hypothetical protein
MFWSYLINPANAALLAFLILSALTRGKILPLSALLVILFFLKYAPVLIPEEIIFGFTAFAGLILIRKMPFHPGLNFLLVALSTIPLYNLIIFFLNR